MKKNLNLGLIGFGRMGNEIASLAPGRGHTITINYDSENRLAGTSIETALDVLIDFSIPAAVVDNVKVAAEAGLPLVVGTTGWLDKLNEVRQIIESSKGSMVYASNFSLGMNIFFRIVENASVLFDKFENYDPFVHEVHHRGKLDSPSGTALALGEIIVDKIRRKDNILAEKSGGRIRPNHLHVTSTRAGSVPGTHSVCFDSSADTIEIRHTARNRSGFALGALVAAEWIVGKTGLFTMEELLSDLLA